jgi:anti-sigma factor RsiW
MKVTRDVVLDLLPVYLAGEASPDTRALVEEYLRQDPDLERRVRARDTALLHDLATGPSPEMELASLRRTRQVLARLRWTCALATTFTVVALALRIDFTDGRLTTFRFLIADHPVPLGTCLLVGAVLWVTYFTMRRRAGGTGLA